jgi:hypothetical protein
MSPAYFKHFNDPWNLTDAGEDLSVSSEFDLLVLGLFKLYDWFSGCHQKGCALSYDLDFYECMILLRINTTTFAFTLTTI